MDGVPGKGNRQERPAESGSGANLEWCVLGNGHSNPEANTLIFKGFLVTLFMLSRILVLECN